METHLFQPSSALEDRLVQAFRERSKPGALRRQEIWPYWATAAAAIVLVIAGVIGMRLYAEHEPKIPSSNAKVDEVQSPATAIAITSPSATVPIADRRHVRPKSFSSSRATSATLTSTVAATELTTEITTDFVALGPLNTASLQDGGQIVRVELPRSAMARLGIPVNMDRYNERVKADILLGLDGLAHAIRFVQ